MNIQLYSQIDREVKTLAEVWEEIRPLPSEVIFLGMATDNLPVLMNARSAKNIVIWDKLLGQGLKIVKAAIEFIMHYKNQSQAKNRVEFIIMSNNASEWEGLNENHLGVWDKDACIAVVPFWDTVADKVLFALAGWCYGRREANYPIILFIDGLENIDKMSEDAQHNLQYILDCGNVRNISVIGTARSVNRDKMFKLLEGFKGEIFGIGGLHWFEMDEAHDRVVFYAPRTEI